MISIRIRRAGPKLSRCLLMTLATGLMLAICPTVQAQTRSFDGSQNNQTKPLWGSAGMSFQRMETPNYSDGKSAPTSGANAREISNALGVQSPGVNSRNLSSFVWQWGQFLDHDIALTPTHATESYSIPVNDTSDALYPVIPMMRSDYDTSTGTTNPRQQVNANTSYIDASMVYGSSQGRADALRTFSDGMLSMSSGNLLPYNTGLYENANEGVEADSTLFLAGDIRVNEQPGLIAMHTVFAREHNRLAAEIKSKNAGWSDEQIYQHARKMVGGMVQSITYNEYLPTLMGGYAPSMTGASYDSDGNATLSNEFATAAFRLGHTQVTSTLLRVDNDGQTAAGGNVELSDAFFAPSLISSSQEIDFFLNGMAHQVQQATDLMIVDDLRNMLFGAPGAGGLDLFAINVQRGRDHGLPTYNEIAAHLGFTAPTSFAELTDDTQLQLDLASVYSDVSDVDLWVGLLAENKIAGSEVGHVLGSLLNEEFTRLMECDRFFFTWDQGLSQAEIDLIMDTRLSDILGRNTSLTNLSGNVFFAVPEPTGTMFLLVLGVVTYCRRRRMPL